MLLFYVWQVAKYREKLSDLEYYRSRVEELRQDNRVLEETREMLEEQLARARKRGDHLLELEASILQYKQTINDLVLVCERTMKHGLDYADDGSLEATV